ncbi:radical SAM family RiPP maturation amino acid epimerase [Roseibium litorale]|uniref:Radical SAM family RiPP maturation amino acid epimerase n=1 Tax=Roseibium litorale TaxID=2803841 RepID=A0ABR9CK86_9HYPH|nr:radical SAM family RiPP maturation amino acid epimerase [Roseibium litorale]MBD8891259.1 radical SAM family RiPP maturation amino acid epimerase [Roseibium litorale]
MKITKATRHYRGIFETRSAEQIRELAHTKRFMERLATDPAFRQALGENLDCPSKASEAFGLELDPAEVPTLWRVDHRKWRHSEERHRWPMAAAWDDYIKDMLTHRDMIRDEGATEHIHPKFDRWRQRQIRRSYSELGASAHAVVHPIVAFELSEGCTVGCWFCGLSADKFRGHVSYEEKGELWKGVVKAMNDRFDTAVQTGFCYWATDPCDNPDYDRFIEDYYHITGALPQTTTAAPLKDEALTRRVLALFDKFKTVTNRFSVLSVRHLDKIHAAFTPEELMGVELVLQSKHSLSAKAHAGRARERVQKLREAGKSEKISELEIDHTTIACVSGFLVSMVRQTVQLVVPVPGSDKYPLGYRVFGERHFEDAASFGAAIDDLIDTHMMTDMPASWPARFRADLAYEPAKYGFRLISRCQEHTIENPACGRLAGELIAAGNLTMGEVVSVLLEAGTGLMVAAEFMDTVFSAGVLEEYSSQAEADALRGELLEANLAAIPAE